MADGIRDLVDPRDERLNREMTHGPAPYNPWPDVYSAANRGATWLDQQFPHMTESGPIYMDDAGNIVNSSGEAVPANPDIANLAKATSIGMMGINPGARAAPGTAGMFLGEKAQGAIPRNFEKARQLRDAGYTSEQIWNMTPGQRLHYTDLDPKFKYEISDQTAQLRNVGFMDYLKNKISGKQMTMKDVLDHPELYQNYPHLANMPVDLYASNPLNRGYYQPSRVEQSLTYTPEGVGVMGVQRIPEKIGINSLALGGKKNTALHELQHAIQQHEGFVQGYSPEAVTEAAKYNIQKLSEKDIPKAQEALEYLKNGKKIPDNHIHEGRSETVLKELLGNRQAELEKWKTIADNPHAFYEAAGGEAYARHGAARGMKMSKAEMDQSYPLEGGKIGGYRLEDLHNPDYSGNMLNSALIDKYKGKGLLSDRAGQYFANKLDNASRWALPGYLAAEGLTQDTPKNQQYRWWQDDPYAKEEPYLGDMQISNGGVANLLQNRR